MFSRAVSVGTTTAATIYAMPDGAAYTYELRVLNLGANPCYVGGTTVAQGFALATGTTITATLYSGDVLYGIATGGTADVRILVNPGSGGGVPLYT